MNCKYLTLDDVILFHHMQIEAHGGSSGTRDLGLLESAVMMPQAAFGGVMAHNSLEEMAAAYLFHICKNHPFVDGNKRVALMAALVFLDINGVVFECPDDELEQLVLDVASGKRDKPAITEFFKKYLSQ